jgi:hypothetical protein
VVVIPPVPLFAPPAPVVAPPEPVVVMPPAPGAPPVAPPLPEDAPPVPSVTGVLSGPAPVTQAPPHSAAASQTIEVFFSMRMGREGPRAQKWCAASW